MFEKPKVTFVHEWLINYGGAEQVLDTFLEIWPDAPIHTLLYDEKGPCSSLIYGHRVIPSLIQGIPGSKRHYRNYLPLMPYAIEQFDLSNYDIVISDSHSFSKGVITRADQLHISYVHTSIRYAWDFYHEYLKLTGNERGVKATLVKTILHYLRMWDYRTANQVDAYIANSNFVARRIWKTYRRSAKVIYPPVDINAFELAEKKEGYYLTVSRLVPYKRVDVIVEAFSKMPDRKLLVVGDGPEIEKLRSLAGNNVEILGFQSNDQVVDLMKHAKAFIFAAEEDFGIVPVEAQACGTPIIAYGRGGILETVRGEDVTNPTGLFFYEQNPEAICDAIEQFEMTQSRFMPRSCRMNAEKFSRERFSEEFETYVEQLWNRFNPNGQVVDLDPINKIFEWQ